MFSASPARATAASPAQYQRTAHATARIPSLDGLRALSIALVIAWHLPSRDHVPVLRSLWRIDAGNLGVRVFFVISGYLITTLLLAEHATTGTINLPRFYLRRTFRILPAFAAFLVAMVVVTRFTALPLTLSGRDVLHAATYTANYLPTSWLVGHSWSLSVEEQFYLLWPGLLVLVALRGGFRVAVAALLMAPVFRALALTSPHWPDNPRYAFECVADALATGCLLARYADTLWATRWYRSMLGSRWFEAWPLGVLAIAALSARWPMFAAIVGVTLTNVAIAMGMDWSLRFPGRGIGRVLNAAPMIFVGTLSYSLYLWQQPFFTEALHLPAVLSLTGLTACALASYYLVERPALRMRSRLERRLFPKAA